MSEHPVRVGGEAFAGIKEYAAREGCTVKDAADRIVRQALANLKEPQKLSDLRERLENDARVIATQRAELTGKSLEETVSDLVRRAGRRLASLSKYETEMREYERKEREAKEKVKVAK
jgi:hypothetical protein